MTFKITAKEKSWILKRRRSRITAEENENGVPAEYDEGEIRRICRGLNTLSYKGKYGAFRDILEELRAGNLSLEDKQFTEALKITNTLFLLSQECLKLIGKKKYIGLVKLKKKLDPIFNRILSPAIQQP